MFGRAVRAGTCGIEAGDDGGNKLREALEMAFDGAGARAISEWGGKTGVLPAGEALFNDEGIIGLCCKL